MLVLASASPRRQELLRAAGIGEAPREFAERLAREKALTVWKVRPQDIILGADTIVVVGDSILGKPLDQNDAVRMLRTLSGREHRVITGVAVVGAQYPVSSENAQPLIRIASEITTVTMSEIFDAEIHNYVKTGEPMDKAGAYAIQGIASRWIPRIEGDYSNVVGLPIAMVYRILKEFQGALE